MSPQPQRDQAQTSPEARLLWVAAALGLLAFLVALAFHNLADGDLWAKLILGASVLEKGALLREDLFAFTPTLPRYIDHEWGAGLVFYTLLKGLGPTSLMLLKMTLATAALLGAAWTALRQKTSPAVVLWLAAPAALGLLPGYTVVIRSHAFTYPLFALTLLNLEAIQRGKRWPIPVQVVLLMVWTNLHGGFVAGLGTTAVYAAVALLRRQQVGTMMGLLAACLAVTLVNPYGIGFWATLLPAILHPRPNIEEWAPMPLWGLDAFLGFRLLLVMAVLSLAAGWHRRERTSWSGLAMLAITACLALRSRRHAPFFAIACLAFLGPYLQCAWHQITRRFRLPALNALRPATALLLLYALGSGWILLRHLPQASLQILAPVGFYPVREADILSQANVHGNLAIPFDWGSYAAWRLYPNIKVSVDGRYEAAYPESTFQNNLAFFFKSRPDWDQLLRDYPVDFIILNLQTTRLTPEDLQARGFAPVWIQEGQSALFASASHLAVLRQTAAQLPPTTINPLDPAIPQAWWRPVRPPQAHPARLAATSDP